MRALSGMSFPSSSIAAIAVFAVTEGLQIHSAIMSVKEDVEQINMDEVNLAISSIRKSAEEISQVQGKDLTTLIETVQQVAENLNSIDADNLNAVIESLKNTAEGLRKFSDFLSKLFK